MSPRRKDKKEIQDSTTEFFLKVIQKEKENNSKENATKENINYTKTKTFDTVGRFYNYINQTFDKILSSKVSIMILSFAMASILFYTISVEKDVITTSGTTIENVAVHVENLDDSLELSGVPSNVTVGLIGPSLDIVKTNFVKDYKVYLDLAGYEEGEYTVRLKSLNFPDTLKVMLVPDTLKIKLAPKVEEKFDLSYRFINEDELDSQYSVSVDEMDISNVTLRASKETLKKIDRVDACIDVSGKTEAFEQDAKIKAFDSNGHEVNVEVSPTQVHVKCNVASYSKVVNVQANFIGNMATGYQVSNSTLSLNQVTIYGLEEKIKNISTVTVDVNVNDLKSSMTFTGLSLKKESGINKFSTDTVDVTVEVEKVITKKFEKIPIKVLNNSNDYKVSFAGEGGYATVLVTGSETKIASLTADNIQATVDVDNLKVGTNKVDVKAAVDDDTIKIDLLSSTTVTINIERN